MEIEGARSKASLSKIRVRDWLTRLIAPSQHTYSRESFKHLYGGTARWRTFSAVRSCSRVDGIEGLHAACSAISNVSWGELKNCISNGETKYTSGNVDDVWMFNVDPRKWIKKILKRLKVSTRNYPVINFPL